ncbi:MAG TPA: hypothetical protein VFN13_14120 [Rudaea sp.]|nr:hypothetical protein [Rudaea sp.]
MGKQTLNGIGFLLVSCVAVANAGTITVNTDGDPTVALCPGICSLRQAITQANAADTIVFAPTLTSPIVLSRGELLINKALTIAGPGADKLTVSAQNASRVFHIAADVMIGDVTIADGAVTGANGDAGPAGTGVGGNGVAGGQGKTASGACVLVDSGLTAVLASVAIRHCFATGGNGGDGGVGAPGHFTPTQSPGGNGGNGGYGGMATGAAVQSNGSLSLLDSSVIDAHALGGSGGSGGDGSPIGIPPGFGGQGGVGGTALGGAVAAGNGGSLRIFNSTIANSGGNGGNGGSGGAGTGFGGIGGYATGGLLYVDSNVTPAELEFSTLANGSVAGGGGGGPVGPGAGFPIANAINAASTLVVASSIVVGAQGDTDLCYGSVAAATGSANLSEFTSNTANPSTCNSFSVNAPFAQTLKELDASAIPAFMPIWSSPAINAAATCNDLLSQPVTIDQHDTPRPQPQGGACDLGAIEADYIFVDGFGA